MGNSAKKPDDYQIVSSYNQRQWVIKEQLLYCQVWKNNFKNYDAQAYQIEANLEPQELDKYTFRNQNNKDIIGVYHVVPQQNQFLCSKEDKMHVLTERIPLTLNKVSNLTQSQALCILSSAYSGYNTIGSHYGPVMPYQNCIGFNQSGKPKVWINPNFALNKPFKNQSINDSEQLQKRNRNYVKEIFNMVEKRTVGGLPRLRQIFIKKEPTYFQALNILQHYNQTTGIHVPININQKHLNPKENQQQQKLATTNVNQDLNQLGVKVNNQSDPVNKLQNTSQVDKMNQINQNLIINHKPQPVRNNAMMNGYNNVNQNQMVYYNYNRSPIYHNNQNILNHSSPLQSNNQIFYNPNPQKQFQQRRVIVSPPQFPLRSQNTRIGNNHQGTIIQQLQNSTLNSQIEKINAKQLRNQNKSQKIFIDSGNIVINNKNQLANKQLNVQPVQRPTGQNQQKPLPQNLGQQNIKNIQQQNLINKQQIQNTQNKIQKQQLNQNNKQQNHQEQQAKDLHYSQVQKVENNQTLQKHIQQHKSQQHIIQIPSQNQKQQIPFQIQQNLINQPRVYINQQNPQFQHQPAYYQNNAPPVIPMQYPPNQFIQEQKLVLDQFGRIVYVNGRNQSSQPIPGNQVIMQYPYSNQAPPSPQMISKTQNIKQARKNGKQSPNNIKSQEYIKQNTESANDLPRQSQINILTGLRTDQVSVDHNKNSQQRFDERQKEENMKNEDQQIDYHYADLKSRKKSNAQIVLKNQKEPHVQNDQQNDDQYQQYIQLQKERQQRKLRQALAQKQKQIIPKQKQSTYQNKEEQNRNRYQENFNKNEQNRNRYDEFKNRQDQIPQAHRSSSKVIRAYSSNQPRKIEPQQKNQLLSKQDNEQIRRSNNQIRQSRERQLSDEYSRQIQQALNRQTPQYRNALKNNFPTYQYKQPRFGRINNQEPQYYEQSVKQYKSIDQNRYINRGSDVNQVLNRSTKSPSASPERRQKKQRQRQNRRNQIQQSPKSHASSRSRTTPLQIARLDRQREKLQRQRKQLQAKQNQRNQYWNQQKRASQGTQNYKRSNKVRFNEQEMKKQQPQQFDWNKYKEQRQQRRKNEKQQRNKVVQNQYKQYNVRQSPKESKQNSRRVNDSLEGIPTNEPALQNITSVTTAYQVVNVSNADEKPSYEYSIVTGGDQNSNKNYRKRYTKDPQPVIPQSYQVDDIQEYIRKKYNIQSQHQDTAQYRPSKYQTGTFEYKNTSNKYDNYGSKYDKYDNSKYDTSKYDKYDTSKYNKYDVAKYNDSQKYQAVNNMQESDLSGKGDQQLGRHNLLTFMPKDKQKNLYIVENQIKKSNDNQQSFNVSDMEKNLMKFQQSRHKINSNIIPDQNSSYYKTKIQTRIEDYGNGQRVTSKKYQRQYKNQDDPYTKYQSNYQQNVEPSTYQRRKYSRNANQYTKDLDQYKGSKDIDQKYDKYINKKQNMKKSYASSRLDNDNSQNYDKQTRTKSRFEKYTKQSRTFQENPSNNEYNRLDRDKQISGSNTFVKKEGGIDKLSYNELKNMLWS